MLGGHYIHSEFYELLKNYPDPVKILANQVFFRLGNMNMTLLKEKGPRWRVQEVPLKYRHLILNYVRLTP